MKPISRYFLFVIIFFGVALECLASGDAKQFQQNFSLRGRLSGTVVVIGLSNDEANIQTLINKVIGEAERTFDLLDASNPSSEVASINSRAGGQEKTKVSWQVMDAFKAAQKLSFWTNGAFDIVASGGDHDSIDINYGDSTVLLKNSGMQVSFEKIIDGYMADYIINLFVTANMKNAMVKVENVFRGVGYGLYGPWKIQVQEDSASFARHALNLTVSNSGIATISATAFRGSKIIDYRSKEGVSSRCKGVTVIMNEAVLAKGISYAVFVFGPSEGLDFLNKFGKARGLIVDLKGQFFKTAGM